ncbi:isoprenylcysteine carboxylmethyltransferase family protein [Chloroflexia bacterium SDU3-3]|nr:isoprenylcysteine carboxylmethyltransferase family protein [Chloroflexia bacterium SDU3-3]
MELKIPPVVVFLIAAALMWLLSALGAALTLPVPHRSLVALPIALAGAAIGLLGVRTFRRAATTVDPLHPDKAATVVRQGIYRHTRNPMYLGLALALLAWAVFFGNALALLVLPLFILYMTRFQIVPEERALAAKFGEDYRAYTREVRRWI